MDESIACNSFLDSGTILYRVVQMSMNEIKSIKQSILEIDFDRTFQNESGSLIFRRFGISKYHQYSIFRNTFQCHWTSKIETISFRIDNGC